AGFARGVGERFHAAVILITRTVERDLGHAGGARTLGDRTADGLRGLDIARSLEILRDAVLHRRRGGKHVATGGVEQLRIDMARRAMHREAGHAQLADLRPGLHCAALAPLLLGNLHRRTCYFFLPSFSTMRSSE